MCDISFRLYFIFLNFFKTDYFLSFYQVISLMNREFANGQGDQSSIPGWVIPKTQKMVLNATLLNPQHHKVKIKVKWSNPGKGVAPSPTPQCSHYWKGSLQVTLDYGRQLYFTIYIYIYIYVCVCVYIYMYIYTLRTCKLT